jgi:RTX calcium-binding nonapeptide repeat (4 copies)
MAFARIGSEFLVNATTLGSQAKSSVTALADGRFVVTWTDNSLSGGDTSEAAVRGRVFNADGSQSVPEFPVNTTTLNSQTNSSVTTLGDGRFVVTWTDNSLTGGDTSGAAVRGRIFNADGSQSVPEFLVNTTTLNDQTYSRVTALADGRFVVTWSDASQSGGDTDGFAVRSRVFNADGTQSVPEFLVNTTTLNTQFFSNVTALADGRFVVTWSDYSATGGDTSFGAVRSRIFNADGSQSVPEFLVNTTTPNYQNGGDITTLADGRFVVTWGDSSQTGGDISGQAVRARIFNPDGSQSVPEFLVNTTTLNDQSESRVTALADGRFVVTWIDSSQTGGDTSSNAVRGQVFAANGTKSGAEFLINTTTLDSQIQVAVIARPDGSFVVTWTDFSATGADTSSFAVRAQVFDSTLYYGDVTAETVTGGNFVDRIYGYGGEDVLGGGLGNDYLNGGDNSDTLNGDDGNDRLDGGTGADRMFGGLGSDTYYVDNIGDTTDEATGGGGTSDYVYSSVTFTAAPGIERLYLTGSSAINATGQVGQNDILVGNTGNNILNGLAGADLMRGGLGSDTYYVDNIGDITDEVKGGGGIADYVYSSVSFTAAAGIERLYLTGTAANGTGRDGQNDIITGNAAANTLSGLGGNDVLVGGLGNDTLNGGTGQDIFRFDTKPNAATNMDTIIGFIAADDTIQLENAYFTALTTTGTLTAGAFNTGTAATQADDRIIYNTTTGALLYDADGTGGTAAVQFALLSGHPALSAVDFFVY